MNKKDNILKNLPIKTNCEDSNNSEIFIHSFTPMLEKTVENMNKNADQNPTDSTCTRFVRKKFICIIVFFMAIITMLNFFGAVTEKLSEENVQQIYRGLSTIMKKISPYIIEESNSTYVPETKYD